MSATNLSRRGFLRTSAVAGGGVLVGFSLAGCSTPSVPMQGIAGSFSPNAFLQFGTDNSIRFYVPRDEMGQGVTTGLTTIIAEELDVHPASMVIELAGAHPDYGNPAMGGVQATGGSTAIAGHYDQLRQIGANVRALILDAAAQDLDVAKASLTTDNGHVVADVERYPYGKFLKTALTLAAPEQAELKNPADFKYIGAEFARLDGVSKSTGTAVYGIDVDVPGMHHAVVKRSPVAGGRLISANTDKARSMPGVTDVVEVATGMAVVAEKYWQAKQAAETLELDWELPELAKVSTQQIKSDYEQAMTSEEGKAGSQKGEIGAALDNATHTIDSQYWAPYLSHAPMEPMNAVVHVRKDDAEVWSGTQGPGAAQGLVARYSGLPMEKVTSHQTYLGGAFGRRATLHHVIEATQVSKATGKPIHLLWSREDDIKSGVYRPASLMNITAGVDDNGKISAWRAKRVGGNITPETLSNMLPAIFPGMANGAVDWVVGLADKATSGWVVDGASVEGLSEDYDLPNHEVEHVTKDHGLPLTFWRSVGHSYTAFAKEVAVDELAELAGQDPVAFRRANLENNPRLAEVVKIAGEKMQAMNPAPGRFLGFAAHGSFKSYVAEVAEVSVENNRIKVHNVLCVVDCGVAINPDVIRAQMEGAVMYGLTAALHGNHELRDGEVQESNFHDYPIVRMNEAPKVDVVIVESSKAPTGVGEPGLPPIAPAVANAVYRATNKRLRSLPLRLDEA